jgi:hypothetical protein
MNETCNDVEKAIDFAFSENKFVLNFYSYLKIKGLKRDEALYFLNSSTADNLQNIIEELDLYLEGGTDKFHSYLREAYGHLPKPYARKLRNYLNGIILDTKKYINDKRPGRRAKNKAK